MARGDIEVTMDPALREFFASLHQPSDFEVKRAALEAAVRRFSGLPVSATLQEDANAVLRTAWYYEVFLRTGEAPGEGD